MNARLSVASSVATWLFFIGAAIGITYQLRVGNPLVSETTVMIVGIPAISALALTLLIALVPGLTAPAATFSRGLAVMAPLIFSGIITLVVTLLQKTGSSLEKPPAEVLETACWLQPPMFGTVGIVGLLVLCLLQKATAVGPSA